MFSKKGSEVRGYLVKDLIKNSELKRRELKIDIKTLF